MRKNTRMPDDFSDRFVVVVVDPKRKELEWFDTFSTDLSASAYCEGLEDAWAWSRGSAWDERIFNLNHKCDYDDWVDMGSPGAEFFGHLIEMIV